eukprot:jgi/Psemu1/311282/fgenesh1_kg.751_\
MPMRDHHSQKTLHTANKLFASVLVGLLCFGLFRFGTFSLMGQPRIVSAHMYLLYAVSSVRTKPTLLCVVNADWIGFFDFGFYCIRVHRTHAQR